MNAWNMAWKNLIKENRKAQKAMGWYYYKRENRDPICINDIPEEENGTNREAKCSKV